MTALRKSIPLLLFCLLFFISCVEFPSINPNSDTVVVRDVGEVVDWSSGLDIDINLDGIVDFHGGSSNLHDISEGIYTQGYKSYLKSAESEGMNKILCGNASTFCFSSNSSFIPFNYPVVRKMLHNDIVNGTMNTGNNNWLSTNDEGVLEIPFYLYLSKNNDTSGVPILLGCHHVITSYVPLQAELPQGDQESMFVGVQFDINQNNHFGWIEIIRLKDVGNATQHKVGRVAYKTVPGAGLKLPA